MIICQENTERTGLICLVLKKSNIITVNGVSQGTNCMLCCSKNCCSLSEVVGTLSSHKKNEKHVCWFGFVIFKYHLNGAALETRREKDVKMCFTQQCVWL